jgi:hypothetical protein
MIDFPNSPTNGQVFTSVNTSWIYDGSKWVAGNNPAVFLPLTGGTLTGSLGIDAAFPSVVLSKSASGNTAFVQGRTGTSQRWLMYLGDNAAESGSNAGSNFSIWRYNDAGAAVDSPLLISRATGAVTFTGPVTSATTFITGNNQGLWGKDSGGIPRLLSVLSSDNSIYIGDNLRGITLQGAVGTTSSVNVTTNVHVAGPSYGAIRLNTGDATVSGWLGLYLPNGTRLGYLGNNTTAPGFVIEYGASFVFSGGAVYINNGQAVSQGVAAGFIFTERDNANIQWQWYATATTARLWRSTGGDLLILDSNGNLNIAANNLRFIGSSTNYILAQAAGGFSYLTGPDAATGAGCVMVSGGNQGWVSYYRNQTHEFDNYNGSVYLAIFNTAASYNPAGAWQAYSDRSIKDNIEPYTRGLEAILNLAPITYTYKAGTKFAMPEGEAEPTRIGLIAQDVELHIPEIVGRATVKFNNEERTIGTLTTTHIIFSLINAVKELNSEIEALKSRVLQ